MSNLKFILIVMIVCATLEYARPQQFARTPTTAKQPTSGDWRLFAPSRNSDSQSSSGSASLNSSEEKLVGKQQEFNTVTAMTSNITPASNSMPMEMAGDPYMKYFEAIVNRTAENIYQRLQSNPLFSTEGNKENMV